MDFFGDIFDFNGDGQLDAMEQGAAIGFMVQAMEEDKRSALRAAGLSETELRGMSSYERRRALINAGLNPDAFDF